MKAKDIEEVNKLYTELKNLQEIETKVYNSEIGNSKFYSTFNDICIELTKEDILFTLAEKINKIVDKLSDLGVTF